MFEGVLKYICFLIFCVVFTMLYSAGLVNNWVAIFVAALLPVGATLVFIYAFIMNIKETIKEVRTGKKFRKLREEMYRKQSLR
jgi:hypothetical protein